MSVFTEINSLQVAEILTEFELGELTDLQAIPHGTSNSNYFLNTSKGDFVFTIIEELDENNLKLILKFCEQIAEQGIPCPVAINNRKGQNVNYFNNKIFVIVPKFPGQQIAKADPLHCGIVGELSAKLHKVGQAFPEKIPNAFNQNWRAQAIEKLHDVIPEKKSLLDRCLKFDQEIPWQQLPQGLVHCDLFKDNVIFSDHQLTGVFDFYYACSDALAFDLAITINDWCCTESNAIDLKLKESLLEHYQCYRKLSELEQQYWPQLQIIAAARFWLSRLMAKHFPRPGKSVHEKNPLEYEQKLVFLLDS